MCKIFPESETVPSGGAVRLKWFYPVASQSPSRFTDNTWPGYGNVGKGTSSITGGKKICVNEQKRLSQISKEIRCINRKLRISFGDGGLWTCITFMQIRVRLLNFMQFHLGFSHRCIAGLYLSCHEVKFLLIKRVRHLLKHVHAMPAVSFFKNW